MHVPQDKDGVPHVVLFAGRTRDKVLLNDAWDGTLTWPNVTWRQVAPQLPAGQAPAPRRGHSAVLVQEAAAPQMVSAEGQRGRDGSRGMDGWGGREFGGTGDMV